VENILRGGNSRPSVTVISGSVTLTKVIGLNGTIVTANALLWTC
jgi:hypothetical protein